MDENLSSLLRTYGPGGPCPPEEVLSAYLEGLCTRRERKILERHLLECPLCREEVERAERAGMPPLSRRKAARLLLPWAAAALVLGLAAAWMVFSPPSPLDRAGRLLARGEVPGALHLMDSWLGSSGRDNLEGKARCLSLLLPSSPRPSRGKEPPSSFFRGGPERAPLVYYPFGKILERRPSFHIRREEEDVVLRIWSLEEGERGRPLVLRFPRGTVSLAFPSGRPSLKPGSYALEARKGGLSRVSWFQVLPRKEAEALEAGLKRLRRLVSRPPLLLGARIRFCLDRGLEAKALLLLRGMDPALRHACPGAGRWLKFLERRVCSGS